jgi:hypothetical protein
MGAHAVVDGREDSNRVRLLGRDGGAGGGDRVADGGDGTGPAQAARWATVIHRWKLHVSSPSYAYWLAIARHSSAAR